MNVSDCLSLRPYQLDAIEAIRDRVRAGYKKIAVVMPTGGGKTIVAGALIKSANERGTPGLFMAHRKELIDQSVEKLQRFGVHAGVIMASDSRRDDYLLTQVASVQTLVRRLDRKPPAGLVIVDECHHAISATYRKIIDAYPDAVVIGLTATPWRSDKLGLADIYETSILATTPAELIRSGALVNFDCFAYDAPDLHDVKTTAGEFNQRDLGIACNTDVLVGSVVREYIAHALGRPAIMFPVNIAHSEALVQDMRANGVSAEHIDCNTPGPIRDAAMRRFRNREVMVLSSVGVLTEGFDAPAAEVCIVARPTKSLSLHIQMIGRVLRPSPETGKVRALIHDHAGNILRHGFPDEPRDYSLKPTPSRVTAKHTCPACKAIFSSLKPDGTCPQCGTLISTPTICKKCNKPKWASAKNTKDSTDGGAMPPEEERDIWCSCVSESSKQKDVVEGVRIGRAEIEAIRGQRAKLGLERELTDEQLERAKKATREERAAEYLRLRQVAESKGFKPGFVSHQYREVFGVWPKFKDEELNTATPAERPFFPLPKRTAA